MERNLIMLGTGHAMVTRCYNTCFCIQNAEDYLLVDAGGGNGILSRLEEAQIPVEKYTVCSSPIPTRIMCWVWSG